MLKVTDQQIGEAIVDSGGIVVRIAERLNVSRTTIYLRLKASEELAELLGEEREATLDLAESKLIELIKAGDGPAIRFYLRTMGRHRGYTTRVEVEGRLEHSGQIQVYLPDNGRGDQPAANHNPSAGPWPKRDRGE